jgi:hypothetical protein
MIRIVIGILALVLWLFFHYLDQRNAFPPVIKNHTVAMAMAPAAENLVLTTCG